MFLKSCVVIIFGRALREEDVVTGEIREERIEYDKRHLPVKARDGAGNVTEYGYREDGELMEMRLWEEQRVSKRGRQ
ncbi:MAG: hypothetical protein LBF95_09790 [Treponema sp.]|jgi:YD repeat-containing protein|nr:hypothetical protein [Treponema sp.]